MRMIENDQYRMVSFSKRRKGLFKKAAELSALTGARTAVLVVSQAGRPHSSVSPPTLSLDSLVDQFLSAHAVPDAADEAQHPPFPAAAAAASSITGDCSESLGELLNGDFSESLGELLDGDFSESLGEGLDGDFFEGLRELLDGDFSESPGEPPSVSIDEFLSAQVASDGQDPALPWIGELLGVEIDKSESVGELLSLKETLAGLRESVRSALDFQFVNSLFA